MNDEEVFSPPVARGGDAVWYGAVAIAAALALPAAPASAHVACDTTSPVARPAPSASAASAPASKFTLAEAACGWAATPTTASPAAAPRRAAQLALYEQRDEPALPWIPPRPAAAPLPVRAARPAPGGTVQRILALVPAVAEAARRHGIDPLLLHAVAHVESRHQVSAHSPAGARGVMQVMPATARRFGLGDPQRELLQADLNIDVGAGYLKTLQRRFGNDLTLVLAAYNAGEGAVEKYGRRIPPYPETQAYVRQVLATYAELRRRLGVAGATAPQV